MSIMNVTGKGYYFIFSGRVETRDEKGLSAVQTDGYFGSDKTGLRVSVQILENTECGFLPMSSLVRILASAPDAVLGETQVKKLSVSLYLSCSSFALTLYNRISSSWLAVERFEAP